MTPDNAARYGTFSRFLHWAMALGIGWMLASAITHSLAKDSGLDAFMWPTHKHVGSALMVLVVVRLLWALVNAARRPASLSLAAKLGHWALYALMFAIPFIGLLRLYGSARAFSPLGLPIFPGRDESTKIQWMTDLGGALHGELGWVLLAAVLGHIAMAWWHRRSPTDNVLPRMIGSGASAR